MSRSRAAFSMKRLKKSPYMALLILIVIAALYISDWMNAPAAQPIPAQSSFIDSVSVHFIDVGQGESILIQSPEKTVLIDAGENDKGPILLDYFRQKGIETIDLAIGTHPHSDHIGGMDYVMEHMPVTEYWMSEIPEAILPTTKTFTDLLDAVEETGVALTIANVGDTYELGAGARLTVIGPVGEYDDLNDISLVCRLDVNDVSFLFTGDMEKQAENDLISGGAALRADILSVGHHGSNTSSTKNFLNAVYPSVAVISCGVDNSYGHPHKEVVQRLEDVGAEIYRTDVNGSVIISTDGKTLEIEKEK